MLVSSAVQLDELARVLTYKRIRARLTPQESEAIVGRIRALAELVEPVDHIGHSPDPDDNRILAIAVAGEVDAIVSGDKTGMLDLGHVAGIPVLSPGQAAQQLEAE